MLLDMLPCFHQIAASVACEKRWYYAMIPRTQKIALGDCTRPAEMEEEKNNPGKKISPNACYIYCLAAEGNNHPVRKN